MHTHTDVSQILKIIDSKPLLGSFKMKLEDLTIIFQAILARAHFSVLLFPLICWPSSQSKCLCPPWRSWWMGARWGWSLPALHLEPWSAGSGSDLTSRTACAVASPISHPDSLEQEPITHSWAEVFAPGFPMPCRTVTKSRPERPAGKLGCRMYLWDATYSLLMKVKEKSEKAGLKLNSSRPWEL